jgi:hypothetical protein
MIKWIIRLLMLLVIGLIMYNYFLGDKEEKETSEVILKQVKDLGTSLSGLLVSEKEKFDHGKYDKALDRISEFTASLKKSEKTMDSNEIAQLRQIEMKEKELRKRLNDSTKISGEEVETEQKALQLELRSLLRDADTLLKSLE